MLKWVYVRELSGHSYCNERQEAPGGSKKEKKSHPAEGNHKTFRKKRMFFELRSER